MRRFTYIHPSGLLLARCRWVEQQQLRLLPWASHPAVTHDACQGGDDPADTGPDHVFTRGTSKQRDHSHRATSRRTPAPVVDPHDPQAAYLRRVTASDLRRLTSELTGSVESLLMACRAALAEHGGPDVAGAKACLAAARKQRCRDEEAGEQSPGPAWRLDWHDGLVALASQDFDAAWQHFHEVHTILPGESIPTVALGLCAEYRGDVKQARRCYGAVWQRDKAPAGAAFGLARLLLHEGERKEAADVLDAVPRVSRQYDAAQLAAIRAYLIKLGKSGWPTAENVRTAALRVTELLRDDEEHRRYDAEAHVRLKAWVQLAALALYERSSTKVHFAEPHELAMFGNPPTKRKLRRELELSFAELVRQARNPAAHRALLDRKNKIRPVSWW
ncbi:tetratricopeptide repeat protein [Saccharopolyspora hattusasensis]|uniref:tetratricopeptide repeat protein n=1 Tax=Saccharopolyspora hattusasensis TaxID=1128679 RepID=UPI003D99B9B7